MTIEKILETLDDILATGTGHQQFVFRVDLKELADEIRRDLILFPEVYTCPTSRPPSSSTP